jgi:glutamine synthetase
MDAIARAIEGLGITVEQMHAESAYGQFEVVCKYDAALKACNLSFP